MISTICVLRLSALGDVLMFVPTIRRLQEQFPNATITWIISRPAYDLVEGMDGVEFIVIEKPKRLLDYWHFKRQMRHRYFDVLLAAQASLRANLLYPCIRAKRKIGYDKARANDGHRWFVHETIPPGQEHTLEGFLKFSQSLGCQSATLRWGLPVSQADYAWARAHIPAGCGPLVVVNPAASKAERSWLVTRYIEVILYLKNKWQARVILTGGPGTIDRQMADAIVQAVDVTDLVGSTRPKQLLALIDLADVVLCPDTGPAHMATAMSTPVVALHAVTNPQISGPYLYRQYVVDYYQISAQRLLKKTTKNIPWGTQVHDAEAMSLIPVDAVRNRLDEILQK